MANRDIVMSRLVPGAIMLLIEIHCFPYLEQITMLNGSPAASEWINQLIRDELVEVDPTCPPPTESKTRCPYITTGKGLAHIDKICELPLPTRTWI